MENLQGGTLALPHSYHIDRRLGTRGLVTLYEATQEPFSRPVLVTVYDRAYEAGAEAELFAKIKLRAQRASEISGQGILRTVDYGELDHGIPFVIGEYLRRPTSLQSVLDQAQTLSPEQILELIEALAKILDRAHAQGLAHGGLAPHWIFFGDPDDFGSPSVANFNLGLSLDETLDLPNAILSATSMGPMSPDRFDDRDLLPDANEETHLRSFCPTDDVYALGVLAYQALVGVHPYFEDPTDISEGLLRIKADAAPDLTTLGIEPLLSKAVARALARSPEARFSTPNAFAAALREAIAPAPASQPVKVRPAPLAEAPPLRQSTPVDASQQARGLATVDVDTAPRPQPQAAGPAPGGYATMGLFVLFVLSNLIWFFAYLAGDPAADVDEPNPNDTLLVSTLTLPGGLQVKSEPSGAEIFVVTGDQSSRIGTTPHVVTEILEQHPDAELLLKMSGYRDQRITLEHGPQGSDLLIYLAPLP